MAVVDLDAVRHNVRVLREFAGDTPLMVVVKSDGYNHGAVQVARASLEAGARELGVTTIAEGLALRAGGITVPVLAWLHATDTDYAPAIAAGIGIGVSSPRQLVSVIVAARAVGTAADVSLKVDTGLNRNGVAPDELDAVFALVGPAVAEGSVRLVGIFSHLACGDEPDHPANDAQAARLKEIVDAARSHAIVPETVHLSNSAAVVTRPDLRFDMVRPGIAVYGLSPIPDRGGFGLMPAMTVSTRVALVKRLKAGESVSYGHTWTTERDTVIALIPMGYADGVVRSLSGRFDVSISGRRHRSVGRVCMDQFVVDLGPDGSGVAEGDEAILFGSGGRGEPLAQDWASELGTIHYEIVTGIRGRVRRRYAGESST